jgi:hypothetical protein
LRLFGIFCARLKLVGIFYPPVWYIVARKIWQPCCKAHRQLYGTLPRINLMGNYRLGGLNLISNVAGEQTSADILCRHLTTSVQRHLGRQAGCTNIHFYVTPIFTVKKRLAEFCRTVYLKCQKSKKILKSYHHVPWRDSI